MIDVKYFSNNNTRVEEDSNYLKFRDYYDNLGMKKLRRVLKLFYKVNGIDQYNIEKIIGGPAIVVANHQHQLDPFFIGSVAEYEGRHIRIRWVSKPQNFKGYQGRLIDKLGAIRLDSIVGDDGKERRVMNEYARKEIDKTIKYGDCVGIFPEGTRKGDGTYHKGAARYALEYGIPILPVAIVTKLPLSGALFSKIDVAFGEPIFIDKNIVEEYSISLIDRKKEIAQELTDLIKERVEGLKEKYKRDPQ